MSATFSPTSSGNRQRTIGVQVNRFRWDQRDLALREAVCLFRSAPTRSAAPNRDWRTNTLAGLALTNDTLK